jgi:hypothetical protein
VPEFTDFLPSNYCNSTAKDDQPSPWKEPLESHVFPFAVKAAGVYRDFRENQSPYFLGPAAEEQPSLLLRLLPFPPQELILENFLAETYLESPFP